MFVCMPNKNVLFTKSRQINIVTCFSEAVYVVVGCVVIVDEHFHFMWFSFKLYNCWFRLYKYTHLFTN